jgi:hypothetical protein
MSHLIIDPFDTVYTPEGELAKTWHGKETVVEGVIQPDGSNVPRVFCPVMGAGFKVDFDSNLTEMPVELAEEIGQNPISDWKVLLADLRTNGQGVIPVHVAKGGYVIHQNRTLFDAFVQAAKQVVGEGNFTIATIGTLGAYSQFFISIQIKGQEAFTVNGNDIHSQYFNLISSHNGLVASATMLSIIRMVCMNTVQLALAQAEIEGSVSRMKHTKNSLDLITSEAFELNLRLWTTQSDALRLAFESFSGRKMSLDGFRSFAAGVFTNDGSDNLSTVSFNRISELEVLFSRGLGNKGETLFDGINAFTEYFTTGAGVGRKSEVNKRIASASFGRGSEWKREVLRICCDEEEFDTCIKRGERFYADKLKASASVSAESLD